MILCEDTFPQILNEIIEFLEVKKDVELIFLNDEAMKELNLAQRKIDKSTDVLSFPLQDINEQIPLGSIVINMNLVEQKAKELGHSEENELTLLFLHGLLHLLGFDHEKDEGQMREKERQVIEHFKLPKSLILRNELNTI